MATPGKPATRSDAALTPQMLGFRLLKLTNLLARPFFGRVARQHAITLNEWRTIVVLAAQPGSAAQDVAAATGLHPMNVSRALAGLRRSARIREARDPGNHRRTLLWLTAAGERLFAAVAPTSEAQASSLLTALSAAETAALGGIVDKLTARAELIAAEAAEVSLRSRGRSSAPAAPTPRTRRAPRRDAG